MPFYDYVCASCNHIWEETSRVADRKLPEGLPCPKCATSGKVEQLIVNTVLPVSCSLEATRALKSLNGSAFQEKLSQIHANTPGSQLDKSSRITKISV